MRDITFTLNETEAADVVRALTQLGALVTSGPNGGTQTALMKIAVAAREVGVPIYGISASLDPKGNQ